MLERSPAPTTRCPSCFGLGDEAEVEIHGCDTCPVYPGCHEQANQFAQYESLRARSARLHKDRSRVDADTLPAIYAELYRRVYGKVPKHANTPKTLLHLTRADEEAAMYNVPIRTWINANLHGMKMAVHDGQHKKYGFQPNMLRGEGALNRVRVAVQKSRRKVGHDGFASEDRDNPKRAIEDEIVSVEAEVVSEMLRAAQRGTTLTFDDACARYRGSLTWDLYDDVRRHGHSNVMVRQVLDGVRSEHEKTFFAHVNGNDLHDFHARVPTWALEIACGRVDDKLPDAIGVRGPVQDDMYETYAKLIGDLYRLDAVSTSPPDAYRPGKRT